MSRTKKGSKAIGFDYWSRRPMSGWSPSKDGKSVKFMTHRRERIQGQKDVRERLDD